MHPCSQALETMDVAICRHVQTKQLMSYVESSPQKTQIHIQTTIGARFLKTGEEQGRSPAEDNKSRNQSH